MTSFVEIKQAIDATATAFEEFKKQNEKRLEALAAGNEAKAKEIESTALASINAEINKHVKARQEAEAQMKFMEERLEELESRREKPGATAEEKLQAEYKSAFTDWIRQRGQSAEAEQKMQNLMKRAASEFKAVTIGTAAAGGYAVPEEISREVEKLELKFSPVRSLVKVVRTGSSDYKELVSVNAATGGWVAEGGTRSATNTPTLVERAPTHGELYAYPQASEWSLDDMFFSVENWLSESIAEVFAVAEATSVISGDGSSQLTGLVNAAPTNETDESGARTPGELEFVPNVDAGLALLPDQIITLAFKLNSRYRANATWVFNSNTAAALRKLKDSTNQYLWQPGLQAGAPDMLLGRPTAIWEQIADVGNNAFPIMFGDFRRGYVIADRVGMRMTRDNVTAIGHVKFYVRRREGGTVLNWNAVKVLKTTTA